MKRVLGLFLTVASGFGVAQQYGTTPDSPSLPSAVQHPSSQSVSLEPTRVSKANLPDAPSYATQQRPLAAAQPPVHRQFFSPASSSVGSAPLIFVGGTSAGNDAHQPYSGGANGPANCGRASPEKSDGGGWINSLLSVTSKSGHYCALGEGGFWRRGTYAMGRAFAAHKYDNANSFTNPAEFFAPGMTPTSASFNPYQSYAYQYNAGQRLATRYATAVGRDTLRNMFREFWPDFSSHVLKRQP